MTDGELAKRFQKHFWSKNTTVRMIGETGFFDIMKELGIEDEWNCSPSDSNEELEIIVKAIQQAPQGRQKFEQMLFQLL